MLAIDKLKFYPDNCLMVGDRIPSINAFNCSLLVLSSDSSKPYLIMNETEKLLSEALTDATTASDEAMRLTAEFGNDPLLMDFVATANQYKSEIFLLNARLQQLKRETPSPARNAKIQLLLIEAIGVRARAGRFKERVMEVSRND